MGRNYWLKEYWLSFVWTRSTIRSQVVTPFIALPSRRWGRTQTVTFRYERGAANVGPYPNGSDLRRVRYGPRVTHDGAVPRTMGPYPDCDIPLRVWYGPRHRHEFPEKNGHSWAAVRPGPLIFRAPEGLRSRHGPFFNINFHTCGKLWGKTEPPKPAGAWRNGKGEYSSTRLRRRPMSCLDAGSGGASPGAPASTATLFPPPRSCVVDTAETGRYH